MKFSILLICLLIATMKANGATVDFNVNGVPKAAKVDTVTPGNTVPVPMRIHGTSGSAIDAATEAKQDSIITGISGLDALLTTIDASTSSIDGKIPSQGQALMSASVPVAIASDQSAIPSSQSGTWNINDISGTISLPTGAATEATLSAMSAKLPAALGSQTSANSLSVVLASDHNDVPVQQSGTWNINDITGTVSLPTGAATELTLSSVDSHSSNIDSATSSIDTNISSIDGKLPAALGQTTSANSLAVVPSSDYVPPAASIPAAQTVKQAAISIGTSAVRLTTDASAPDADRRKLSFMLDSASTATCYYGSSSVTTSGGTRGIVIFPGATQDLVDDANDYYMICSVAAQTVYVVEVE